VNPETSAASLFRSSRTKLHKKSMKQRISFILEQIKGMLSLLLLYVVRCDGMRHGREEMVVRPTFKMHANGKRHVQRIGESAGTKNSYIPFYAALYTNNTDMFC